MHHQVCTLLYESKHLSPEMHDYLITITPSSSLLGKKKNFHSPKRAGVGTHKQAAFQLNLPWVLSDGAPSYTIWIVLP